MGYSIQAVVDGAPVVLTQKDKSHKAAEALDKERYMALRQGADVEPKFGLGTRKVESIETVDYGGIDCPA
jgi:hypothetical protein